MDPTFFKLVFHMFLQSTPLSRHEQRLPPPQFPVLAALIPATANQQKRLSRRESPHRRFPTRCQPSFKRPSILSSSSVKLPSPYATFAKQLRRHPPPNESSLSVSVTLSSFSSSKLGVFLSLLSIYEQLRLLSFLGHYLSFSLHHWAVIVHSSIFFFYAVFTLGVQRLACLFATTSRSLPFFSFFLPLLARTGFWWHLVLLCFFFICICFLDNNVMVFFIQTSNGFHVGSQ